MKNKNIRQIRGIQKEAESLVVELKKTTDPQVRAEKTVSAWRWIAGQVPILQARSAAVVREFARMEAIYHGPPTEPVVVHARREDVAEGEHQDAGFWLVTIIEMIAASKLASMYWRLSAWLSILIAALFAWITSKALTPIAVGFIRQGADRQGEVMKGRARRMLIIIGLPWFLSLVGAIWTLRSGAGMVGDVLFEVCTALVTFLSPAFAAACRASATHFTWSAPLEEEDAAIRLAMASIEMLRIALEPDSEGPASVLGQIPPRVNGPAAAAVVPGELPAHAEFHAGAPSSIIATGLVIVAAVFITEPARAQESHVGQSTIAKSSTVNTGILRLKGKLDKSSSPNKSRMIARFNSFLNAVAEDPREIVIELVAFGSDAWDETLIGSAHLAPLSGGRCSRELSERAKLSNPAFEHYQQFCAQEAAQSRQPIAAARIRQLQELREAVTRLQSEPVASCTAVFDAIQTAEYAGSGQKVFIFSDFTETCRKAMPRRSSESPRNQVFAVPILPNSGQAPRGRTQIKSESEFFESVRTQLEKDFPRMVVIEPFRFPEAFK